MWTPHIATLHAGHAIRVTIARGASPMSYLDAIDGWQRHPDFRVFFADLLADAPFRAFRWETPPVTVDTVTRPFEFVLLDSPDLKRHADTHAFAEHFSAGGTAGVTTFANLGNDAVLVAPCPTAQHSVYSHLAVFMRDGPEVQRTALWKQVGLMMRRRLSTQPVWLSTAGTGVAWLHVRLDDRPKYYGYAPYRRAV